MTFNKNLWEKGYVHVYTGNGKGKTSAALGLALRAAGAGIQVFIGQFMKGKKYSELKALERFPEITIRQYGRDCFIKKEPTKVDIIAARKGLEELSDVISSGEYPLVVLDEANVAVYFKLFTVGDLHALIDLKPVYVELVITGRNAEPSIIDRADLVTEMKEVKHYYQAGVKARKGIEK